MRSILAGIVLATGVMVTAGAAGPAGPASAVDANTAAGTGAIHFGKKGTGVGFFDFNVVATAKPTGTFFFGGEDHHGYPDVVIRLHGLDRVVINGRTAYIKGKGALQDHPVLFTVVATDGTNGKPDTFKIDTVPAHGDDDGDGFFHAEGEVFNGSIRVGVGES